MNQLSRVVLLAVVACAPAVPASAGLSPVEERIAAAVDAGVDAAVALLEETVNVNSGTMNAAGVRQVGEMFAEPLRELGFEVRLIEQPPELRRGPHLFAERRGSRGKRVLLIGHLDTVFEAESSFQSFSREGTKVRGPGVEDMKGGNIVALLALQALHSVGALDDASIVVAFTGDEEHAGRPIAVSRRDLFAAGSRSDVALGFEAGVENLANLTVARRGSSEWRLEVEAPAAHSSGIFDPRYGSGAVYEAARILHAFHEELRGEKYATFNPAVIVGGTDVAYDDERKQGTAASKTNIIASKVIVDGDLRTISPEQLESMRGKMRAVVERGLPKTSARIEFEDGYPSMTPTAINHELLRELDGVSRDLGFGAVVALDPAERGAADISFLEDDVAALDGLGLIGGGGHTVEEWVDISSLAPQAKRTAVLIHRLLQQDRR